MANISTRDTPEGFLVDYFREPGEAVSYAPPRRCAIPMVLKSPQLAGAGRQAEMYSTRCGFQYS